MDIPKFEGENLEVCIGNESMTLENPEKPLTEFLHSDKMVMNLEDMR
jgi:hypothetical protein